MYARWCTPSALGHNRQIASPSHGEWEGAMATTETCCEGSADSGGRLQSHISLSWMALFACYRHNRCLPSIWSCAIGGDMLPHLAEEDGRKARSAARCIQPNACSKHFMVYWQLSLCHYGSGHVITCCQPLLLQASCEGTPLMVTHPCLCMPFSLRRQPIPTIPPSGLPSWCHLMLSAVLLDFLRALPIFSPLRLCLVVSSRYRLRGPKLISLVDKQFRGHCWRLPTTMSFTLVVATMSWSGLLMSR